ncbi:hypothetical protein BKA69DRAFT_1071986 [Paraphysoderma sedebokerense]|nr:hypothetical protein BKA69DRAFT_1071986 [Paraphysoderma sedebokerense]
MSTTSTDTSNIPVTIIVSGLFACAVAILVSLAIERFGGVVGGVLGSIPTTIVPAAYGFWVQFSGKDNGVSEFQRALMSVSPGMVLNGGFLILWRYLPNIYRRWFPGISMYRLLASVLITSTMIWLGFAISLVTILRAVNGKIMISVDKIS